MEDSTTSVSPLLPDELPTSIQEFQLYTRRWYILGVFAWFTFMQCSVWATWGPISTDAQLVYGWSEDTIALLANWGPIIYIPTSFFFSWLIDVHGLRPAMVISTALVAVGSGIRCFTTRNPTATILMHVGHILNAAAGPTAMSAPAKISQEWFHPGERTTATALGVQATILGMALSFVVGPYLVNSASSSQIYHYLFLQTILSVPVFFVVVVYYPSIPPSPPSVSANKERAQMSVREFIASLKVLSRNGQFLLLATSYGMTAGFYNGWMSVLNINLSKLGYDQGSAGWIGFAGTVSGAVGGIVVGMYADRCRNMKLLLLSLFGLSTIFFCYFSLGCAGIVPNSQSLMMFIAATGGFFLNTSLPLFYELSVEVSHPIGEGTVSTMLTNMNNVGCMIFLFFPITYFGTSWMNWAVTGVCGLFGFALLFFKEEYVRYNLDLQQHGNVAAQKLA